MPRVIVRGKSIAVSLLAALGAPGPAACGTTTTTDSRSTHELGVTLCENERHAPCGSDQLQQACLDREQKNETDAAREGCTSELAAYLRCATSHPIEGCSCIESGCQPIIADSCGGLEESFSTCVTGVPPDCVVSFAPSSAGGPVSCNLLCPSFASECQGPATGPLDCSCTQGPHTGATFRVASCNADVSTATGHVCNTGKPWLGSPTDAGTGGASRDR